jgi:hypothetical protein
MIGGLAGLAALILEAYRVCKDRSGNSQILKDEQKSQTS